MLSFDYLSVFKNISSFLQKSKVQKSIFPGVIRRAVWLQDVWLLQIECLRFLLLSKKFKLFSFLLLSFYLLVLCIKIKKRKIWWEFNSYSEHRKTIFTGLNLLGNLQSCQNIFFGRLQYIHEQVMRNFDVLKAKPARQLHAAFEVLL